MNIWILALGLLAQVAFSARTLCQWILSERARKVLSPSIFWILSLGGAVLLSAYGWLRNDFAIVAGQFISYYIYVWNLKMKGVWGRVASPLRIAVIMLPICAVAYVAMHAASFAEAFISNPDVPAWLLVFGMCGQCLFTFRFIYQYFYSRAIGESELPPAFWWISSAGAVLIFIYGVIRLDPVLMLAQSFGLIVYVRNLLIGRMRRKLTA